MKISISVYPQDFPHDAYGGCGSALFFEMHYNDFFGVALLVFRIRGARSRISATSMSGQTMALYFWKRGPGLIHVERSLGPQVLTKEKIAKRNMILW
uniref:Uncharacterized protein n=1 Tax=Romanomermis culicivorax TaxID=13658 RepID=A0A915IVQ4_ROMCU